MPVPQQWSAVCRGHSHSHDSRPTTVAVVGREHPLIHMRPAPHQQLLCVEGHSHSHETSPTSAAAMGRGYPLIHMIPAPHQQRPCVGDSALSLIQGDMGPSWCKGVTSSPCAEKREKVRSNLMHPISLPDFAGLLRQLFMPLQIGVQLGHIA